MPYPMGAAVLERPVFDPDLDADTSEELARMCPTPRLPSCPSAEVLRLEQELARERCHSARMRRAAETMEAGLIEALARAEAAEKRLEAIDRRVAVLADGKLWRPRVEGMIAAIALMLMGAAAWIV